MSLHVAPQLGGSRLLIIKDVIHEQVGVAGHHGVHVLEVGLHPLKAVVPIYVYQVALGALVLSRHSVVGHKLGEQHCAVTPMHLHIPLLLLQVKAKWP